MEIEIWLSNTYILRVFKVGLSLKWTSRLPINSVEVKIEESYVTLGLEAKQASICTLRHNGKLIKDQRTTSFEILLFITT